MYETTRLKRRKLDVSQLEIGMFVCDVDRPWRETPFLFQGFPLLTVQDLRAVQACCQYVFIDEYQRVKVSLKAPVSHLDAPSPTSHKRAPLSQEMQQARRNRDKSSALIKDVFFEIQLGRGINTAACRELVHDNLQSLLRTESAMRALL